MKKIHYISNEFRGNKFIIAETNCGKHWQDINEFTSDKKDVTCKTCLNKITN